LFPTWRKEKMGSELEQLEAGSGKRALMKMLIL
jgi:hypothetical protein